MDVAGGSEQGFRPVIAGSTLALPGADRLGRPTADAGREVWTQHLSRLRRAGFEAMDLVDTWLSPADLSEDALDSLRAAVSAVGLELVGVSVIRKSIIDPVDGVRNLEHTLRSIEAARRLGAPLLCIGFHRPLNETQKKMPFWLAPGPVDDRTDETYALAVERLRIVCERAAKYEMAVSLELYEDTLLNTGASAAYIVDSVGAPNLGLNPDLANLYRSPSMHGETWLETLERCAPMMNYWHVKNFARVPVDGERVAISFPTALGSGDMNYRVALETVFAFGYSGPICIEHYGGDALAAQKDGLRYMTELLDDLASEREVREPWEKD